MVEHVCIYSIDKSIEITPICVEILCNIVVQVASSSHAHMTLDNVGDRASE